MTKKVITVSADVSISDVAKILHENKIHGIPVVEGGHLKGIITETDFFMKGDMEIHLPSYIDFLTKAGIDKDKEELKDAEFKEILEVKAGDIMTTDCITIDPEDNVRDLIAVLKEKNIHTVPVTRGDLLEGLVTVADIIKLI